MKAHNSNVMVIAIITVLFFFSLILNIFQYRGVSVFFCLKGTYCTDSDLPGGGEYLIFDDNGNYCRYIQTEGILENGTYVEAEENQFSLTSDSKKCSCMLLVKGGAYLFSENNTLIFYSRISNKIIFLGRAGEGPPTWSRLDSSK